MKRLYSIFVAMLVGTTSLFAQTNYTVTFSANVEMEKVQVTNTVSGETKTLYMPDNVITLQKNKQQETAVETVDTSAFLNQTGENTVVVNMEKAGHVNLTLYSLNGTFVARYSNNVDAGPNAFKIGAASGVYVLVASANNQSASLKLSLTQSTQPSILEILTSKPEALLKSFDDVITFDEGDEFEFIGYYKNQTDVKKAVITRSLKISFTLNTEPSVNTTQPVDVLYTTATVGGNVTKDNGVAVTERGVCWATTDNPTISDNKETSGDGVGAFTVSLTELADATTYYVRAYAINEVGISYGETNSFTTQTISVPTVSSAHIVDVSESSVTLEGTIVDDNGATVTEQGVCWATTENPTVSDNKVVADNETTSFSLSITGLEKGTIYYVRTYAVNSIGIAYGDQILYMTPNYSIINGVAKFSVSDSTHVYFSQGNLQYQASTGTWRFAENTWDYVGNSGKGTVYENGVKCDNAKISETYDGWIDLFGWGTSGYNGKNPYKTSPSSSGYGDGTNDIAGTNYDWGVYNKISNGGNQAGMWRTLTNDEWRYLIYDRTNADVLYGIATVNGVTGLILLPDGWETPPSVSFTYKPGNYYTNWYSLEEWTVMQSYGAVFLPGAGYREQTSVSNVGYGGYWSSSMYDDVTASAAHALTFEKSVAMSRFGAYRHSGRSVRLVQDVK